MACYKPLGHGVAPLASKPIGSSECAEETPLLYHAQPFSVADTNDLLASGIQPEEVYLLSRLEDSAHDRTRDGSAPSTKQGVDQQRADVGQLRRRINTIHGDKRFMCSLC
jgi:U3 small nucleolar ribonucleoprotein component